MRFLLRHIFLALVLTLLVRQPALAVTWTNWNNGQSIGSFFAMAGTSTETVAVGIDGRISTRNNSTGIWTIQTFTGDPDFRGIIYAKNQYVTVREGGTIMTSPDGLAWTSRTSPTTNDLRAVLWDGHQYVAGGQNGTIVTSPDGVTWTLRNSGSGVFINSLSYSGSVYIAVGGYGIIKSTDAINWTPAASAPTSISFEGSAWTGSAFVAGGFGSGSTATIYSSTDGNAWTLKNSVIKDNIESVLAVNGILYITGAINGSGSSFVQSSTDGGATWMSIYTSSSSYEYFEALASNGQSLIAAGFNHNVWATPLGNQPVSTVPNPIISSAVAIQWQTQTGVSYQVQSSTDMNTWTDFGAAVVGDGTVKSGFDVPGTTPKKFYRIVCIQNQGTLQVVSAKYGANSSFVDVTSNVQNKVVNNTLNFVVSTSALGVSDPAFGYTKQLTVSYVYNGSTLSKTVSEGATMTLP